MPGNGPFYFAEVDATDTTFGAEHHVEDKLITAFTLQQKEGDFAELSITVANPQRGPIASGTKQWCWFSWRHPISLTVIPLFFGRIVAMPTNILKNLVDYRFLASPVDFDAQKRALAETLKVLPFYDPLLVSQASSDDPDAVLEARSAVYHTGRTDLAVTISDVLLGEDGLVIFTPTNVFRDSVDVHVDRAPALAVTVKMQFPWSQFANTAIDFGTQVFQTADPKGLANSWPQTGQGLAGGYYVVDASAIPGAELPDNVSINVNYTNREKTHRDGDLMHFTESLNGPPGVAPTRGKIIRNDVGGTIGDPATGTPTSFHQSLTALLLQSGYCVTTLKLGVAATNNVADNLTFTVFADTQPVLRDPVADADVVPEVIDLTGANASQGADPPIGDQGRAEYITTDRGMQSIVNGLLRCRARLVIASRVASVSWGCRFADAVVVTCRKNARISDARVPGGQAEGKVIEYSMTGDGNSGAFAGTVKIGCSVGLVSDGNLAITPDPGEPDWVVADWIVGGWQPYVGVVEQAVVGQVEDVGFSPPVLVTGSGASMAGLTVDTIVIRATIMSELFQDNFDSSVSKSTEPYARGLVTSISDRIAANVRAYMDKQAQTQTWLELELLDLSSNNFDAIWTMETTRLNLPRQIDLEAS